MKIAELLKAWRHRNEMTIEEAAKAIGLSWDVYRRVELGGAMQASTFTRIVQWMCGDSDAA